MIGFLISLSILPFQKIFKHFLKLLELWKFTASAHGHEIINDEVVIGFEIEQKDDEFFALFGRV
jgi:hypothetical protein